MTYKGIINNSTGVELTDANANGMFDLTSTEVSLLVGIVSVSTGTGDNDKLVTQGYVDDAVSGENNWDRAAATLSPHNENDKVTIPRTTSVASDISLAVSTTLGADVGVSGIVSTITSGSFGYTDGSIALEANIVGNANDAGGSFAGFAATVNKNGGTSEATAFEANLGFDYCLFSQSGSITLVNYDATIQTLRAVTQGAGPNLVVRAGNGWSTDTSPQNGGSLSLLAGTEDEGGTHGEVLIGKTGDISLKVNTSGHVETETSKNLILGGDLFTKVYTADLSNPPTAAQLTSTFGSPADGAHFMLDDNDAQTNVYHIFRSGSAWFYTLMAKAV